MSKVGSHNKETTPASMAEMLLDKGLFTWAADAVHATCCSYTCTWWHYCITCRTAGKPCDTVEWIALVASSHV